MKFNSGSRAEQHMSTGNKNGYAMYNHSADEQNSQEGNRGGDQSWMDERFS